MEIPKDGEEKAKADRLKFESIEKVSTHPVIIKGNKGGGRTLIAPELKSPDEQNPQWVTDPEDIRAAKRAARKKNAKAKAELGKPTER